MKSTPTLSKENLLELAEEKHSIYLDSRAFEIHHRHQEAIQVPILPEHLWHDVVAIVGEDGSDEFVTAQSNLFYKGFELESSSPVQHSYKCGKITIVFVHSDNTIQLWFEIEGVYIKIGVIKTHFELLCHILWYNDSIEKPTPPTKANPETFPNAYQDCLNDYESKLIKLEFTDLKEKEILK